MEPSVVPVLAAMGKEMRKNGAMTREDHLFIQDVYLNGGRHVARHDIETALGFNRMGELGKYFHGLQESERLQGRIEKIDWEPDPFRERMLRVQAVEEARENAQTHFDEVVMSCQDIDGLRGNS
jgi:hypothetical protein